MKPLHIAKILFLIVLMISSGLVGCGDEGLDSVLSDNPTDAGGPIPSFNADILPILINRCAFAGCHVAGGPDGIDLRTYDVVMAGGSKGAIVIAGDAGESELVTQIVEGKMPPGGPPLPAAQIQLITDWINEGAKNNLDSETDGTPPIPPDSFPTPEVNRDGVDDEDDEDDEDDDDDDDEDDEDEDDEDDDEDDDDDINRRDVVFDNPVRAGRPSPSFKDDILPILTNRCAFAGCHVAGGPDGIDLRTYNAVIAGGGDDDTVIAGDARESELVEVILEGEMPPGGPPLPAAQFQLIIDWINEGAKNN